MASFQNYTDDNNNNDDSKPSRSTVVLAYKKGKALFPFFFHHRILVEAAHVRKILLVNLGLLQKDTVVSVHKDSGERIVTRAYSSSNANIPAFLCFLVFLFFCFRKFPKFSKVIDCIFKC